MSDRELLELAAKAINCKVIHDAHDGSLWCTPKDSYDPGFWWNPCEYDGEALRLAVKLGLDISFDLKTQIAYCEECMEPAQRNGGDMDKAARRAIVRAAAEIGRAMP